MRRVLCGRRLEDRNVLAWRCGILLSFGFRDNNRSVGTGDDTMRIHGLQVCKGHAIATTVSLMSCVKCEDEGQDDRRREVKRALFAEQPRKDLRRVVARIDLVVDAFDSPAGVDKKADAFGMPCLEARAGAEGQSDLVRGIAEQPEAEIVFAPEGRIVGDAVKTDADYLDRALVEVLAMIAQAATLQAAA